jgi:subtilisin family serine protease
MKRNRVTIGSDPSDHARRWPARLVLSLIMLSVMGLAPALTAEQGGIDPSAMSDIASASLDDVVSEIAFPEPQADADTHHAVLLEAAARHGSIPVIVHLRETMAPEATLDAEEIRLQRDTLAEAQERVLGWLTATTPKTEAELGVKRFALIPAFAIQADEHILQQLLSDPEVLDVVEDVVVEPTLQQSVPLIGADGSASFAGRTGQSWVVAVLDTGVEKTHPFLSSKVVSEACYSTTYSSYGSTSLCPGGASSSIANGSGQNCSSSISGCDHGTHVAGIAAGKGNTFSGVAQDAGVIAIQVFSRFDGQTFCGSSSPCVLTYSSDQIRGLERVFELRESYQIAAVNMSLGGGRYYNTCDDNSLKPIIDQLRAAGIATVIASGNDGYTDSMSGPACISSAVSVGSTTKSDVVSWFSNSASFLDVLAPGSVINASVPGGGFASWSGTSMAAPHVAGAWAVLKQANPSASVSEVLTALKDTGGSITDTRAGAGSRVKPRVKVDQALAALVGTQTTYNLTVNSSGASGITISADPGTYAGTTNYTKSGIASGTSITLTAPNSSTGSTFGSWSGCSSTSGTSCTVSMSSSKIVTVTYTIEGTQINAAILPYARAISIGETATAFASVINSGNATATDCSIALPDGIPATLSYQTTNAANALIGNSNTPVDITPGTTQGFVFGITPSQAMTATEIPLVFDCANTAPAPSNPGLNTFILSAAATAPPDLLAIGATPSGDGVVQLPSSTGVGFFATAAVNIGSAGEVTVSADDGGRGLPLNLQVCETTQAGAWIVCGNSLTRSIGADQTAYYSVFATGTGQPIAFDPANNRLFLRFAANGTTVGATNVAVTAP